MFDKTSNQNVVHDFTAGMECIVKNIISREEMLVVIRVSMQSFAKV